MVDEVAAPEQVTAGEEAAFAQRQGVGELVLTIHALGPQRLRTMRSIPTQHLIHVGFPKAGSTSLQAWFRERPQIAFVPDALGGYVGAQALMRDVASGEVPPAWCVTSSEGLVFPRARDDHTDVPADGPIAARRRRMCEILATLFAGATILIVTRGFRGVLASLYSADVQMGGTRTLDEFLSRNDPSGAGGIKLDEYFDYDAAIGLYEHHFGSENVIALPYEIMRDNPAGFIASLEDRLDLSRSCETPRWLNSRLTGAELAWYPRFSRAAARTTACIGVGGDDAFAFYRARIGRPGLRRAATLLARLSRSDLPDPYSEIPDDVLERFRGRADTLAGRAHYAPYHAEYLIELPASPGARGSA